MWLLNIYFHFFAQSVAFVIQGGEYVLTDMFYEPTSCQTTRFYNHLNTDTSLSLPFCGVQCFANSDCRRIMFDRKTKQCSMFESGENCFHNENIEDKVCYRLKSICSDVNCTRCPIGYYGDACQHISQDCSDGANRGVNGGPLLSYIQPADNGSVIEVKCDFNWGGITFFQHRDYNCLETDFNKNWDEYEHGFGKIHGEYWLGLQNIYDILQNHKKFQLSILVAAGSRWLQGYYHSFTLSNSTEGYKFDCNHFTNLSNQPLGDSLTNGTNSIQGRPFSTYDRDYSNNNCPEKFKGGWWYLNDPGCSRANPNGRRNDPNDEATIQWLEHYGFRHDFHEIQLRLVRE